MVGPLLILGALLLVPAAQAAGAAEGSQIETVATSKELARALRGVDSTAGVPIIQLQPGTYDNVAIHDISGPVRLVAADPGNPPRITSLRVKGSRDISFEGLVLDFVFDPATTKPWASAFQFDTSERLVFDAVVVDGDLMHDTGTDGDGYPAAKGLVFIQSRDITISDSEIHSFYVGINFRRSSNITLKRTYLHGMRKDSITMAQVQDVAIIDNRFGGHNRSFAFDDHPDVIQMWTQGTDQPSERITIRGNVFNSEHSPYSQTLFMRNETVDKGLAGPEMFYRDLVIENNVIINAHVHGIAVGETDGLIIRNNTLIRNPSSEKPGMSNELASPSIRVAKASRNVVIENNAAYRIPAPAGTDWSVRNNLEIQRHSQISPGYYAGLFTDAIHGDPRDLASFRYSERGLLHQRGIGAAILDTAR